MGSVLIVLLLFGLFGGANGADGALPDALETQQAMEAVLAAPESVFISEPNVTTATQLLVALPEPEQKPAIAVYSFEDKTGQNKVEGGAVSRVVSQGASDMLISALMRSRQFVVLDRIRFNDVIQEQNLQTSNRLQSGTGPAIGNLTGADYVLTGAITEYQVDKETGGLGLVIAGKGGSTEYARATTAIDLRLIDTSTGEVVWAESLRGEILGEKVGLQVFSFLGKNIVEFETGEGMQEVVNLVLRTLIEEAVFKLAQHLNSSF